MLLCRNFCTLIYSGVLCNVLIIFIYLFVCHVLVQLQRLRSDWGRWDNEEKANTQTHRKYCLWVDCSLWWWWYCSTSEAQVIHYIVMYSWTERQIMAYSCTRKQAYYIQINKEAEFLLYSWIKTTGLANHVWSGPSSGAVSLPWISKGKNLWWTFSAHMVSIHVQTRKERLCPLSKCLRLWGLCYACVISKCSLRTSLNQGLQGSLHSCVYIHTRHICGNKRTTFTSLFSFHMMVP